jgi:hypothetical protein
VAAGVAPVAAAPPAAVAAAAAARAWPFDANVERRVRVASWIVVACAVLTAVAVFLPAIQLEVHGHAVTRASLSLYKATTDRELARALFGKYRRSSGRRMGEAVTAMLVPRLGQNKAHLDDAQDAMSALDSLDDADIRHAGIGLEIGVWALVVLAAAMAALVFAELMREGGPRTRRLAVACALAVIVAALAVGARIGCGEAVWEANDEVGYDVVGLATGARVLAFAACGALVAIVAAVVLARRRPR